MTGNFTAIKMKQFLHQFGKPNSSSYDLKYARADEW